MKEFKRMQFTILIADPRDIHRAGLRTLLQEDPCVSTIYEAASDDDLATHLQSFPVDLDLLLINQSMVSNLALLPEKRFVILTSEPCMTMLKAAYDHGARGYLSENVSGQMLRTILYQPQDAFLLEPTLTSWLLRKMFHDTHTPISEQALTPREKEIMLLLREGLDRPTIARRLNIADTTLKTHIKNIAQKSRREGHREMHEVVTVF
jgi:DNA-binding NarL/FixJ family response regulator